MVTPLKAHVYTHSYRCVPSAAALNERLRHGPSGVPSGGGDLPARASEGGDHKDRMTLKRAYSSYNILGSYCGTLLRGKRHTKGLIFHIPYWDCIRHDIENGPNLWSINVLHGPKYMVASDPKGVADASQRNRLRTK